MTSLAPAGQMLFDALEALAPATLLAVGPHAAVDAYAEQYPDCAVERAAMTDALPSLPGDAARRFRVGVVGALADLPDTQALKLVAALRDRYCEAILVPVPASHWSFSEFLGLGFELRAQCEDRGMLHALYWFDIERANPEREWNNAVDWAHPENFNRFRW